MVAKLTINFRAAVVGYLTSNSSDAKLVYFNKLVEICTSNATRLFIPTRTVGFGKKGKKIVKDNLVKDLAEEFVLEQIVLYADKPSDAVGLAESGEFDYWGRTFKQRVLNKIRDVHRSSEEMWVDELPADENKDLDDE